jgi:hypothetical protein
MSWSWSGEVAMALGTNVGDAVQIATGGRRQAVDARQETNKEKTP